MDFKNLDLEAASESGVLIDIKHPVTGELLEGVSVRMYNTESARWKAHTKAMKTRFAGREEIDPTGDEFTQAFNEVLADCVIEWTGIEWDDKPLKCNKANAKMLFDKPGYHWLVSQIKVGVGDTSKIPLKDGSG